MKSTTKQYFLKLLSLKIYKKCDNFLDNDRGIDFINASMIFDSYTLTIKDDRYDYGEERFVTFGILEGRVVVVVHTENEDSIRIISVPKATKYEEKKYFSQIPD